MSSAAEVVSPEARLLLAEASRPGGRDGAPSPPSRARERYDWERLYGLAARENAAAALHPMDEWLPPAAPSEWRSRFRTLGAVSAFRQRRLMETLGEVVGLLDERSISAALLKGAALALTRYDEPRQRPMGDLDLLVEERKSRAAWEVLREAGWVWDEERYPLSVYEPRPHLPPLEGPDGTDRVVELHDRLFVDGHPFGLGPADLRASGEHVRLGGTRVLVPDATQHLVYTCAHFAWAHTLSSGGWRTFRDVAALAGADDFDWALFGRLAREQQAATPCYWTLRLARTLGDVPVPDETIAGLRPSAVPGPVLDLLERHFALGLFPADTGCPSVTVSRAAWRVGMGRAGRARPWEHDDWFVDRERRSSPRASGGRLAALGRHLRNPSGWARYAGAVLGIDLSTSPGTPRSPTR